MSDPYEPKNPNTQLYLIGRKIQEWSPLITVIVSAIALFVIGAQALIYWKQARLMETTLTEIRSGGEVAQKAANAATEQAKVMQRQLDTMQDQANSMKAQTNTLNESLIETRKSVNAAEKQAEASMNQAATSGKIVAQNERIVKAAETQASAAQISTNINSQITIGLQPKLISLNQNGQIATEILMTNISNFIVSIPSVTVEYVFTKEANATATFTGKSAKLGPFDLGPGWKGVTGHSFSPVLTPQVLAAIEDGRLNVFWFVRYFILNKREPTSGCYSYDRLTKDWVNCSK